MSTSTMPWRKSSFDLDSPAQNKTEKGAIRYFFRLESESSAASADDTESVYSVQDKETDVVRDTSDTSSNTSEYHLVDIEYEIESVSASDDERDVIIFDSSGESEDMIYAAAMVADSSFETFVTDAEDSDNSMQDDSNTGPTDYWTCIQCKSQNDHPQYRFCEKCFQDRKAIFPPRPRRRKKAEQNTEKPLLPVKLDVLQSCLNGLSSQDSGISSSQEFGSLCLDQIVVPSSEKPSTSLPEPEPEEEVKSRKRQFSESSLSDEYEAKRPRKQAKTTKEEKGKVEEKKVEEKSDDKKDNVKWKRATIRN
ncbi:uncharacterized protein LOC135128737 isoform X2 [Zophobas morio]|uniref:uncharacterized protein LOC135128737 isoform X2 n=1 Tax=Zophobas morio TaxID=2755281 RepID=UPI003082D9B5